MDAKFENFIQERRYLKNVSLKTEAWYRQAFQRLKSPNPTEDELKQVVFTMRERGLKASSCNCFIRAINAYLRWSGSPLKLQKLKEQQRVLPTFKESDIARFVKWKPKSFGQRRVQLLVLMLADTGCRISELLTLRWASVDFDNLLVTVDGKGGKQRKIPFSFELRRFLFRYKQTAHHDLVFGTKTGTMLSARNAHHSVQWHCEHLGIVVPERLLHAFRHTFATNYLRRGGSVFHLQRVLGHSTLAMTLRYSHLTDDDLKAVHQRVSLLAGLH